jgi:hypothetical protein
MAAKKKKVLFVTPVLFREHSKWLQRRRRSCS